MFIRSFLAFALLVFPLSLTIAQEESCLQRFADVEPIESPTSSATEPQPISTAEIAWIPDTHCIVAAGTTGVLLYDVEQAESPMRITAPSGKAFSDIAVSPDGSQLAFGGWEESIVYLVNAGGTVSRIQAEGETVTEIAFSSDNELIAVASSDIDDEGFPTDPRVQVWNLRLDTELAYFPDLRAVTATLVFSLDNQQLFIGGFRPGVPGESVEYWDIASQSKVWSYPEILGTVEFSENEPMLIAAADTHDRLIAVAGLYGYMNLNNFYGNAVHIWNTEQQELPVEIIVNNSNDSRNGLNLIALAFNSHGTVLASGMTDGTIQLWDVQSGSELGQFQVQNDRISQLAFSPDGMLLAVLGDNSEVYIWDVERMEEFAVLNVG